ncbi:hypothetical protein CDLVIII_5931 [Clostridium sp. DL-VIII]|uniref:hypothetical protein n=1 Tax=Clostridium sp. DL-VIII TaxID=641107 RepID=UPI00023B03DD|nr:hypothetical protein [Clostridium sp. DL-VIII]EHJ02394.1 hypothetical protein CDLVIII_5931 [Clostridium sp. DL-VIII]
MLKGPKRFVKCEGMNHYKVTVNNGECTIYFWSDAPRKITKVLLRLWFKKFRNSGYYNTMQDFFEECEYRLKDSSDEIERYISLTLDEVIP